MNHNASMENALALIDALQAAGAISPDQMEALTKAFSENADKSPEQVFANTRLFNENQVSYLSKAMQLLAAGRLSREPIAIYIMSNLQNGKSLSEALLGLEAMAKPEESSILPPVIQAFRREFTKELMKELEKRLTEFPQVPWEEHVRALNILKPRYLEVAKLGQSMIDQGEITESQFSVALYDELTGMCTFQESLQVRGWWPQTRA